ncbi:hypothetical protein [Nocardia sp. AB354]|uniref:hypothetical protein n=1 Tax=Nocardia sp. AB354 TaxID=3413283 RepID=UPI003C264C77
MAIDDFGRGEIEAAMLHVCNAVDGTAEKVYPTRQVGDRFTALIRDNDDIEGTQQIQQLIVARRVLELSSAQLK